MLDRFSRLRPLLERPAGPLPGGRQMLALARGLLARAVLLLDEPLMGLAPVRARKSFKPPSRLRGKEVALLLADPMAGRAVPLARRRAVLGGSSIGHVAAALDYLCPEAA